MVTPSIKGFLIRILKMFLFPFLIEPFQKYHLKTNICHLSYRCVMTTRAPAVIKITLALFLAALLANCIVALARRCCVVCTIRRKLFASLFKTYILDVCSPLCDWKIFTMPQKIFPYKPPQEYFPPPHKLYPGSAKLSPAIPCSASKVWNKSTVCV